MTRYVVQMTVGTEVQERRVLAANAALAFIAALDQVLSDGVRPTDIGGRFCVVNPDDMGECIGEPL